MAVSGGFADDEFVVSYLDFHRAARLVAVGFEPLATQTDVRHQRVAIAVAAVGSRDFQLPYLFGATRLEHGSIGRFHGASLR